MGSLSQDLLLFLQILLPGFITAWIFYSLTSYAKPSQFERIVQALIFTIFIQAGVAILELALKKGGEYWVIGRWDDSSSLITSVLLAIILGVIFSTFSNNDKFHEVLRNIGITRETSFPSEWFGLFLNNVTYIVLHFHDERRLYGWPKEWPSEPKKGHFVLLEPSWLVEVEGKNEEMRITGVNNILVDVNDVKWVEFLEKTWETKNE